MLILNVKSWPKYPATSRWQRELHDDTARSWTGFNSAKEDYEKFLKLFVHKNAIIFYIWCFHCGDNDDDVDDLDFGAVRTR